MGHGGKRAGAGRRIGVKNKATAEARTALEALAREHTDVALNTLAAVAEKGESEAARVTASVALLDRGYGRPHQTQSTNLTMGVGEAFIQLLRSVNERRAQDGAMANGVAEPPERPVPVH